MRDPLPPPLASLVVGSISRRDEIVLSASTRIYICNKRRTSVDSNSNTTKLRHALWVFPASARISSLPYHYGSLCSSFAFLRIEFESTEMRRLLQTRISDASPIKFVLPTRILRR